MKYGIQIVAMILLVYSFGGFTFAQSADTGEPQLYVGGIIQDTEPRAIVNGKLLRQSDTIQNATVERIDNDGVTFRYRGGTFRKRLGEGAVRDSSWGKGVFGEDTRLATDRAESFRGLAEELAKKAQDNYAAAQDAYSRADVEAALGYYDAAMRSAQGAYAYANETQRLSLQQFMNTCSDRVREIRGEPTNVGDISAYNLSSPGAIASWMAAHIAYKKDETGADARAYWQSPQETLMLERGDCEDLAFLAQAFLEEIGVSSLVVTIMGREKKDAHALCVFGRTPPYNCIDGTALVMVNKESIEELVDTLYPDYYILNRYVAYTPRSIPLFDDNDDVIIPR